MRSKVGAEKLTALRPAVGRGNTAGKAPHKPLLLLYLLDLADTGQLTARTFTRTPGLVLRFRSYGNLVAERLWSADDEMPDYDPVGLSDYLRLRGALAERVSLFVPPDLEERFAAFGNRKLIAEKARNRALLEQLDGSGLAM